MLNVDQHLEASSLDALMIMQVHDELVVEVAEHQAEDVKVMLIEQMMNAVHLHVPLIVEAEIGDNWDQAH
jgi:DNA polymerase-1